MSNKKTTHFGFQEVLIDEKVDKVRGVFDSVANQYDLMNDLMSFGIHRLWKRFTLELAGIRSGQTVLDIAAGTGDLTKLLAKAVGKTGSVFSVDINAKMLGIGRDRLIDAGYHNVVPVQADAQSLPFPNNYFDCVSIGFGLRNVTNKEVALNAIFDTLKPGSRVLILEFSKPTNPVLTKFYDFYSFNILPKLGGLITNDSKSYQYLSESIRMHPDQQTLKQMLQNAGFVRCEFFNLTGGVVAIHRGFKP